MTLRGTSTRSTTRVRKVNFIYPYSGLQAANVAGTRELIRLAAMYRAIPLHYVSSTAVLAGLGVSGVREVTEETPLAHPELLRMGYVETKYVAEELLQRRGLGQAFLRWRSTGRWTSSAACAPAPGATVDRDVPR